MNPTRAANRAGRVPMVILVHGAFHGSWCWERVVPRVAAQGIRVEPVDLPFAGRLKRDVLALRRTIEKIDQDLVICAHSYGGLVTTLAASGLDCVQHLVYIAGYMLDLGDARAWELLEWLSPAAGTQMIGGNVDPEEARAAFYYDCTEDDASAAVARLRSMPISGAWFHLPSIADPAYAQIPSTYVICAKDRALSPDGQRIMAQAATYALELPTGHSAFYSAPSVIAGLLGEICTQGKSSQAQATSVR